MSTVITDELRQLQESRADDLRIISQLTRDIEAELKGPRSVKAKVGSKYVEGVTKSQGDAMYNSAIRSTGAMALGRAFGPNRGMSEIELDTRLDLEAALGSDKRVREYVDLSTQVICHLIMSAAKRVNTRDEATPLKSAYGAFITVMTGSNPSLVSAIDASINAAKSPIEMSNLYPMSYSYIEAMTANAKQSLGQRTEMKAYIAQPEAQAAVLSYITKKTPASNVLLPAAIGGTTEDLVSAALKKYGDKDLKATFDYYLAAVKSEIDLSTGIRTGDAESHIRAAVQMLRKAASNLSATPVKNVSVFKSVFEKVASGLSKVNVNLTTADENIGFLTLDLIDVLGGLNNMGMATGTVTYNGLTGFKGSDLGKYVLGLGKKIDSAYQNRSMSFMDDQDDLRPNNINQMDLFNIDYALVTNSLRVALKNLDGAYGSLISFVTGPTTRGLTAKEIKVTDTFKKLVGTQLKSANAAVKANVSSLGAKIDESTFKKAYLEAIQSILNVSTGADPASGGATALTANNILDVDPSTYNISESMFNRIADGRVSSLSSVGLDGRSLETELTDLVDSSLRKLATRPSSSVRRATRDAVVRSAELIIATLNGLRVQAENIGMEIRQNPMGSGFYAADTHAKKVGVGALALYSDHASSALINRFAQPTAGSIGSYASDYGVSVATALWGTSFVTGTAVPVLNKNGEENKALGYSMIAGAGLHALLRTLYKHNVGNMRFSDSMLAKVGQALVTAPAHLLGDESMGYSALNPADAHGHEENLAEWVANLIRVTPISATCHLGVQLWQHGLEATMGTDGDNVTFNFSVSDAPKADDKGKYNADELASLGTTLKAIGGICHAVCGNIKLEEGATKSSSLKHTIGSEVAEDARTAIKAGFTKAGNACSTEGAKIMGVKSLGVYLVENMGAFIQEPGYNMDIYSGEDQVSYLQPAPIQTAQSGIAQLDAAIARAARLEPHDKMQEGIGDMMDVAIIRATPKTCRMAEEAGVAVSLGQSRMNPHTELLALEVEGDNGLLSVAPARQHSVPQGALNHAKIGPASNVDVASNGLFNRGAFTPVFSR
jgi:hypothetical protein